MQGNRERDESMNSGNSYDGFGVRRNMMSSIFGGRDPFDDPFFTRPFGSFSGSGMFDTISPFGDSSQMSGLKRPVIQELDSGDEEEEVGHENSAENEKSEASGVNHSNKDPIVEHPDDDDNGKQSENISYRTDSSRVQRADRTDSSRVQRAEPQTRSFSFKKVSYGGVDGTYYTATTTRRKGDDGAVLEESKQADSTTGQASHRISRGLNDKGHSVLRKINSDGKVDTMQTLHNLEEDELTGFEKAWKGNVERHFPGWTDGSNYLGDAGSSGSRQITRAGASAGNFPFADNTRTRPTNGSRMNQDGGKTKKVVRINIE